jgi:hypothetical protein
MSMPINEPIKFVCSTCGMLHRTKCLVLLALIARDVVT